MLSALSSQVIRQTQRCFIVRETGGPLISPWLHVTCEVLPRDLASDRDPFLPAAEPTGLVEASCFHSFLIFSSTNKHGPKKLFRQSQKGFVIGQPKEGSTRLREKGAVKYSLNF